MQERFAERVPTQTYYFQKDGLKAPSKPIFFYDNYEDCWTQIYIYYNFHIKMYIFANMFHNCF